MVPMNVAGASNGFEKVCGVPAGTVTQAPASASTFSAPDVKRSLPRVTMNTSSWSRWICRHRRARRHARFDEAQAVPGVGPVLDDPDSDGTAARLLAVVRPDDMDAHSAPPYEWNTRLTTVAACAGVELSRRRGLSSKSRR